MLLCSETAQPIPASTRRRGGGEWISWASVAAKTLPKFSPSAHLHPSLSAGMTAPILSSSVRIIPIFLFSLFDAINLAFLSASPWGRLSAFWSSPTAFVSVLNWFARNARCRSASFSSLRSDEEQLIVWDFGLCADATVTGSRNRSCRRFMAACWVVAQ